MTHVPAIFYGWHIKRESFKKRDPQIAPTILKNKIAFPNGTKANVLEEVLDDK
jgi:hypothetical protein